MRIAVAGATGSTGTLATLALKRAGHDVVPISRRLGVDLLTGTGLDQALDGADVVVDVTNGPATDRAAAVAFFGQAAGTLLAAEERAGVRHHVLLSIVGLDRVEGNPHYAGKREQEALVARGRVPWTIVASTQFHDFPAMVATWGIQDGVARVAPLLIQPIAPADVADVLAGVAAGPPYGRSVDVAGPETQDLIDMARRTYQAWGRPIRLEPTWSALFGPEMAGDVLLPGSGARIAPTTFEEWLANQGGAPGPAL